MGMSPEQAQVWAMWRGGSGHLTPSEIALETGKSLSAIKSLIDRGRRWADASEGEVAALEATGLTPGTARHGWRIVQHEDGSRDSVFWKASEEEQQDFLERVKDAFEGMAPAVPVLAPDQVESDLCNVFPLFDVHWGMHAWGKETRNQDYDLKEAAGDMKNSFEAVLTLAPNAQEAVLIIGGDFFHADDNSAETPKSRHKLDVDGRFYKVVEEAIEVLSYVVERILATHMHLTVTVIRGNHDEHSHLLLSVGLGQRYREDPRVTVQKSRDGLFMKQWGRAAIFAHHGDRAPPERQALYLSDVCPFWSESRHRHLYTGHIHKDQARDIGPLRWESLRAFCPPDAYAAGMGYASRRALRADTYHKISGRVLTAMDPIERHQ